MAKKVPWQRYKNIVNNFHNTANQDIVTWKRNISRINRHGEDNDKDDYSTYELKVLIQYNEFRTWPLTKFTLTGNEDKQSAVMILNRKYLKDNNLLDDNGNFTYDADKDRFVHRGIEYEDAGSTLVSQASDDPLHFYIVLKTVNG